MATFCWLSVDGGWLEGVSVAFSATIAMATDPILRFFINSTLALKINTDHSVIDYHRLNLSLNTHPACIAFAAGRLSLVISSRQ